MESRPGFLGTLSRFRDFRGRASRREYWGFCATVLLLGALARLLDAAVFTGLQLAIPDVPALQRLPLKKLAEGGGIGPVRILMALVFFLPGLALQVRRLHDTSRSAWDYLVLLVPGLGVLILVIWLCLPGVKGPNRYGAPPPTTKTPGLTPSPTPGPTLDAVDSHVVDGQLPAAIPSVHTGEDGGTTRTPREGWSWWGLGSLASLALLFRSFQWSQAISDSLPYPDPYPWLGNVWGVLWILVAAGGVWMAFKGVRHRRRRRLSAWIGLLANGACLSLALKVLLSWVVQSV